MKRVQTSDDTGYFYASTCYISGPKFEITVIQDLFNRNTHSWDSGNQYTDYNHHYTIDHQGIISPFLIFAISVLETAIYKLIEI